MPSMWPLMYRALLYPSIMQTILKCVLNEFFATTVATADANFGHFQSAIHSLRRNYLIAIAIYMKLAICAQQKNNRREICDGGGGDGWYFDQFECKRAEMLFTFSKRKKISITMYSHILRMRANFIRLWPNKPCSVHIIAISVLFSRVSTPQIATGL